METILALLTQIFAPLSLGLVLTAVLAGIVLGVFYNYPLKIHSSTVFHKSVAGWVFIMFIFVFRVVTTISTGAAAPAIYGWIGIGILWTVFCLSIYCTGKVTERLDRRLKSVLYTK